MNERIKKLRKTLDLTQQEFADRIGVKRNTIANYEIGRNEPIDSVLALIVREFNVNEKWLRTGEGEMFIPAPASEFDELVRRYPNLTPESIVFIEKFVRMSTEKQKAVMDFIRDVVAGFGDLVPAADPEPVQEDLYAELDRQIDLEKKAEEKSEVS